MACDPLISIDQAWQQLSAHFKPVGSETVELTRAWGRVAAEPICALVDKPEVALSAMDGYAVRSMDVQGALPVGLKQIGEVPAGRSFEGEIGSGESVRIFTGAPLPAGSDAVVRQEDVTTSDVTASGQQLAIKVEARAGDHIRPAGSDFRADQPLLIAGQLITARVIALAASAGITWMKVRRRPRVAILATGDELIMPGQSAAQIKPGQGKTDGRGVHKIVNAAGPGLVAMIEAWGGQAIQLGIAGDDRDQLAAALDNADKVDLVVSIGGASVGDYDLMHSLFKSPKVVFWQIAMRPGKPLLFGRREANLILGLPGNPVSAMVCALVFLRPLIGLLLGQEGTTFQSPPELQRLGSSLTANDHRQSYLRARLEQDGHGELRVMPFAPVEQDSAILSSLAAADCLVVRYPYALTSEPGELVEIVRFPGSCWRC